MADTEATEQREITADDAAGMPKRPTSPRRSARVRGVAKVADAYFEALGRRDIETMLEYWHPEGFADIVPVGMARGADGLRRFYAELFGAIPDMVFSVDRVTPDFSSVAVEWRADGTFEGGPFQGIDATGRPIDLRGVDVLELDDDGLIVGDVAYYDGMAFARSIGLLPGEGSGTDKALRSALNGVTRLRRKVEEIR